MVIFFPLAFCFPSRDSPRRVFGKGFVFFSLSVSGALKHIDVRCRKAISKSDTRRLTSFSLTSPSLVQSRILCTALCQPAMGRRRLRSHEMIHTRLLKRNIRKDLHIASYKVVLYSLVSLLLPTLLQLTYFFHAARFSFLFISASHSFSREIKLCIVFMDMNKLCIYIYASTRVDEIVRCSRCLLRMISYTWNSFRSPSARQSVHIWFLAYKHDLMPPPMVMRIG